MARALTYITLLGFIPYFILVWRARELRWNRVRATIVTFALLLRFAMLAVPSVLTSDAARYLWDGKVQLHGFNPYKRAPDDPALADLRDTNWELIEHREVPGVYPPLLIAVFTLVAAITPHTWVFKLIFMICDLLTFWLLVQLLRKRKQNESLALIWGLNPLVILEFAGNGHEMSLAIMLFVAGLWLFEWRLTPLGALAFGGAVLAHLLALPLAIMAMAAMRIKALRIWLWFMLPVALGYALFASAGKDLWLGLLHFAGRWQFNGSIYSLLAPLLDGNQWRQHGEIWVANEHTKFLSGALLGALCVWLFRRRIAPVGAATWLIGCILLLGSTVHPWYVTWLVAFTCLEFSLPWLMFSACVLVSYTVRITQIHTGLWVDAAFTRWLEYVPVYALLAVELWRKRLTPPTPASSMTPLAIAETKTLT